MTSIPLHLPKHYGYIKPGSLRIRDLDRFYGIITRQEARKNNAFGLVVIGFDDMDQDLSAIEHSVEHSGTISTELAE